jgi:NTE family protein
MVDQATKDEITGTPNGAASSIGLVLGGGGARGLAHILMLEAFDELGLRPKIIAGTSIGAIFGAAYASGLSGAAIRELTVDALTRRLGLLRNLLSARAQGRGPSRGRGRFWPRLSGRSALLAPENVLDVLLPETVARDFGELEFPLRIVASDFYAMQPAVFESGNLRAAVAASMALPVVFEPVILGGRTLIDGGLTNPLPFDLLQDDADILVAIDVSGVTIPSDKRAHPTLVESLFSSAFLFERSIVREKLKLSQPDIYIEAGTGRFQVLDFLRVREILKAAEPAKDKLKRQLGHVLGAETLPVVVSGDAPTALTDERASKTGRGLLKRLRSPRDKSSS